MILFGVALAVGVAGGALVLRDGRRIPVREATLGGLQLRLQNARWLEDQMEHGGNFERPASMLTGMPDPEDQRISIEVALTNPTRHADVYRDEEFVLVSDRGGAYPVAGALLPRFTLGSGQSLNVSLYFDFDAYRDPGALRLRWEHAGGVAYLPIPPPPEHVHARPRARVEWPTDVTLLLPIGRAERGESLFTTGYACAACHGDPRTPGSNSIGPHLAGIGRVAAERIPGKPALQYIYESLLDSNAFIAPECTAGRRCAEPSAMPEYAAPLRVQEMADLVAYLGVQVD